MCSLDAHDNDNKLRRMGPVTGDVKPGCSTCTRMHALQGKDMAGPTQAYLICFKSSLCVLQGKDVAGPTQAFLICCKSSLCVLQDKDVAGPNKQKHALSVPAGLLRELILHMHACVARHGCCCHRIHSSTNHQCCKAACR
jgi:hypothetical protein